MKHAMRTRWGAHLAFATVLAATLVVLSPAQANAADSRLFDPGFIISDEVFYDGTSATEGEIQAVLNQRGSSCRPANGLQCLRDFRGDVAGSGADLFCSAIGAEAGVPAARILVLVGQACGINPRVLVVLIEKEQALVSRSTPTEYAYRFATGYNCPDTTGCDNASSGFYRQVYLAARQFERYRLNPGGFNHRAGQSNQVRFSPNASCGTSTVFIRNAATAGLYNYTPYQPNAAALSNLYGTGDGCSSYGNRNFWRIYTDWFSNPSTLLTAPSFEGSAQNWVRSNSNMSYAVYRSDLSFSGQHFLAANTNTAPAGTSILQSVAVPVQSGDAYTATIWVRSSRADQRFRGSLALWALGGTSESASQNFDVGTEWTELTVTLDVLRSGHTSLRIEVYFATTGIDLFMDAASLYRAQARPSRAPIEMRSPGFESGSATWGPKNGEMNQVVYAEPSLAHSGSRFFATNTTVTGRSIGQDVVTKLEPGRTVTATVWLRRGFNGDQPFRGELVLWALGSGVEAASTPFEVGGEWTAVYVELPITRAATSLRFEIYLNSTRYDLWIDDASIQPSLLPNSGFQAGVSGWSSSSDTTLTARSAASLGDAVDGSGYAAFNAARPGTSVSATIGRSLVVGEQYRAGLWVRSSDPARPVTGTLALWAIGSSVESATVQVSAGSEWTYYEVTLPVRNAGGGNLRVEFYNDTPGVDVLLDAARLY